VRAVLDPQSPVRVAGVCRIEEADLVAVYERVPALRRQSSRGGAVVFGVLAAALPVYGLWVSADAWSAGSYLFSAIAFAALAGWLLHAHQTRGKRAWAALEEWQRQLRFELSDTGLRVRTERTSNELAWPMHQSWIEVADAFYVEVRGGAFQVLPKRAFDGDAEVALVRELLRANVHPSTEAPTRRAPSSLKTVLLWVLLILGMGAVYSILRR
jgi:hypothetical protein